VLNLECVSVVICAGGRDCVVTAGGHEYMGQVSVTKSGRECQPWASQKPHDHSYTDDKFFPDGSAEKASNYCRNPEREWSGVWCYTTDPNVRYEKCAVPSCGQLVLLHCNTTPDTNSELTVAHSPNTKLQIKLLTDGICWTSGLRMHPSSTHSGLDY